MFTVKVDVVVNVYFPDAQQGSEILKSLSEVKAALTTLNQRSLQMSQELDQLEQEVSRNTEVDQSAITLLTGLAAQIEALKTDPVKLQALADSLRGSSDALAAAVVANTPAQPAP